MPIDSFKILRVAHNARLYVGLTFHASNHEATEEGFGPPGRSAAEFGKAPNAQRYSSWQPVARGKPRKPKAQELLMEQIIAHLAFASFIWFIFTLPGLLGMARVSETRQP